MVLALAPHEPQPVPITRENIFDTPMTPFEEWLFSLARQNPARFRQLVTEWVDMCPAFDGPEDGADVVPPGCLTPIPIPEYWKIPVHLEPGGFGNPKVVRLSQVSKAQWTFTREENVREWLSRLYGDAPPRRFLDIGTGTGTTAIVCAELFPETEVIGIDLSAPYIRFAREWAKRRGLTNVQFYQQNAQQTVFPDASFDAVHFTYVLHEMPVEDARKILRELYRLTTPGGRLSMFDGLYPDTEEERQRKAQFSKITGIEPYLGEYMKLNVEKAIAETGFTEVTRHFAVPDGMVVSARKPAA
ncbi:MAG: methyltransferase domain-containing protein [Chloroflexi bacterium]|nr:methyltransferase domain-containing protein [Chloroflexota bacterium]